MPNLFEYGKFDFTVLHSNKLGLVFLSCLVKYIKNVDGFSGLYTGLGPKVCGNLLSAIAAQKCADYLKAPENEDLDYEEEETEEQRYFLTIFEG